jgi:hypothetical protein
MRGRNHTARGLTGRRESEGDQAMPEECHRSGGEVSTPRRGKAGARGCWSRPLSVSLDRLVILEEGDES